MKNSYFCLSRRPFTREISVSFGLQPWLLLKRLLKRPVLQSCDGVVSYFLPSPDRKTLTMLVTAREVHTISQTLCPLLHKHSVGKKCLCMSLDTTSYWIWRLPTHSRVVRERGGVADKTDVGSSIFKCSTVVQSEKWKI